MLCNVALFFQLRLILAHARIKLLRNLCGPLAMFIARDFCYAVGPLQCLCSCGASAGFFALSTCGGYAVDMLWCPRSLPALMLSVGCWIWCDRGYGWVLCSCSEWCSSLL
jgi:hypothetical protein